jgi:hypothetical protein
MICGRQTVQKTEVKVAGFVGKRLGLNSSSFRWRFLLQNPLFFPWLVRVKFSRLLMVLLMFLLEFLKHPEKYGFEEEGFIEKSNVILF